MENELREISTKLESSYRQSIVFAENLINTHKSSVEEIYVRNELQRYVSPNLVQRVPQFNEEVQHLEEWPYGWYTRWIWEKDTSTSDLKRGTG